MNISLDSIRQDITRAVKIALEEDIGTGDITAELIPAEQRNTATVITREDAVICGSAWFDETFKQLGGIDTIEWHVKDGDHVSANSTLVTLTGNTRALLTGERTALNFLQLLSGTATTASQYAALAKGKDIKILDTRKTIPGLRTAQKYAVVCGGCDNHRIGLYDMFLIKENHIAACGGIMAAVKKARALYPDRLVEVEVENLEQLEEAIEAGCDIVMLDNFSREMLKKIERFDNLKKQFEISGNITINNVPHLFCDSVTRISSGSLTKHTISVDLSLKISDELRLS